MKTNLQHNPELSRLSPSFRSIVISFDTIISPKNIGQITALSLPLHPLFSPHELKRWKLAAAADMVNCNGI
jgi:hypothetical protein